MLSLTRRSLAAVLPAAHRSLTLFKPVSASASSTSFPIVSCAKDWRAADVPSLAATVKISLPPNAADELREHVTAVAAAEPDVEKVTVDATRLPLASAFLQRVERELLVEGPGLAILSPTPGIDSIHERRVASLVMTEILGTALRQNAAGQRCILVYDRDAGRTMVSGQRYHQSHEGGSLHTDNVNVPECWEHMLLTCLVPAARGGENILVSAVAVYNHLAATAPDVLRVLASDFWWEFRGFDDRFYRAPILFFNRRGEPCVRWLREYLESAHQRLQIPLTDEQRTALDLLTATSLDPAFQYHHTFAAGEVLLANDLHLLHGRTTFYDAAPAQDEYDFAHPVNRLMQRNWLESRNPEIRGINQGPFVVPSPEELTAMLA